MKNRTLPIILTLIILLIIIYLFVNIKQPLVECNNITTDAFNIKVEENLTTSFSGNKISEMTLTKTITLPEQFQKENYLESIKASLNNAYEYLGNKANIIISDNNKIIVNVTVNRNETIILKNIEFINNDGLEIKINSNTKSSDVITLKIKDNYTEGEFMTHLKNNGFTCK